MKAAFGRGADKDAATTPGNAIQRGKNKMGMKLYINLDGNSGILAYELGPDWIDIRWADGTYRYAAKNVGTENVGEMKRLAMHGRGLNTFINQHPEVRDGAERID